MRMSKDRKALEVENVRLVNKNRKLKREKAKLEAKLKVYEAEDGLRTAVQKILQKGP